MNNFFRDAMLFCIALNIGLLIIRLGDLVEVLK